MCLNRPRAYGAINLRLSSVLRRHFKAAAVDDRVAVALLTGAEEDFSSGLDIPEAFGMSKPTAEQLSFVPDVAAWREFPKSKVCVVEGTVRGFGMSLLEACDICIAGSSATFQHNEVSLGLCKRPVIPS